MDSYTLEFQNDIPKNTLTEFLLRFNIKVESGYRDCSEHNTYLVTVKANPYQLNQLEEIYGFKTLDD